MLNLEGGNLHNKLVVVLEMFHINPQIATRKEKLAAGGPYQIIFSLHLLFLKKSYIVNVELKITKVYLKSMYSLISCFLGTQLFNVSF